MKRALCLSLASLALVLVPPVFGSAGCSGGAGTPDGGDAPSGSPDSPYEDGPSSCPPTVIAGHPCEPIAPTAIYCAAMCEGGTGGCRCVKDKATSKGVWECTMDSCHVTCAPDSDACVFDGSTFADVGPIPDSFVPPDVAMDTSPTDGAADAPIDAKTDSTPTDGPSKG